jgi:hypothetical protein
MKLCRLRPIGRKWRSVCGLIGCRRRFSLPSDGYAADGCAAVRVRGVALWYGVMAARIGSGDRGAVPSAVAGC